MKRTSTLKVGNTIYFMGKFVKITAIVITPENWYWIECPVTGRGRSDLWRIDDPVIVFPDTPENRLIIALKN